MNRDVTLSPRETEIAELLAWGAAKKEVADRLQISTRTVENTARHIYEKIGIQKATELSVWWFTTHCGVSMNLSPFMRKLGAMALFVLMLPTVFGQTDQIARYGRTARATQSNTRSFRTRAKEGRELEITYSPIAE